VAIQNPFYGPETQGAFSLHDLGNLVLESGETLRGAKLAYRTVGTLNAAKSNAVLLTTWFSGTGKVMQDVYVGLDHALNPER
jgi:homoserine O-acetyltransferase